MNKDNYLYCFASFLLGRNIYGPGKYIFGVFDTREMDETYKVIYNVEEDENWFEIHLNTQLTRKQPADFIVFFSQKLRITFECGLFSSADFIFFLPKIVDYNNFFAHFWW